MVITSGGSTKTDVTLNSLTFGLGRNSLNLDVYQGSGSSETVTIGNLVRDPANHGVFYSNNYTTLNHSGTSTAGGQGINSSVFKISQINGAAGPVRRLFTNATTTLSSATITVGPTAGLGLAAGMTVSGIPGAGTGVIQSVGATTIVLTSGVGVTASTTASLDVDNLTNGIIGGWFIISGGSFATYDSVYGVSELGDSRGAFTARAYTTGDMKSNNTTLTGNFNDGNTYTSTSNVLTTGVKQFNTLKLAPGATSTITPVSGTSYEFNVGWMTNAGSSSTWDAVDATNTMKGLGSDLYIFLNQSSATINTKITGSAALNFMGTNTLVLAPKFASNDYSGGTYVQSGTLNLSATATFLAVPGDLFVNNASVSMSAVANQIATSSNVSFTGSGRVTLGNYTANTTQTLAKLDFLNDGGTDNPGLYYMADSTTGTSGVVSKVILTATNAITAVNNSFATTPFIALTRGTAGSTQPTASLEFSAANPVITVNGGLAATGLVISVPITQNGSMTSLTKAGTGLLALSGANTFSSPFTLSAGSLLFGVDTAGSVGALSSGPVGTGTLTLANGTALLSNSATRFNSNAIVAQGNFSFGGVNQLNNLTLNGPLTLSSATAVIGVPSAAVTATLNGTVTASAPSGGTGLTKTGDGILVFGSGSSLVLNGAGLRVSGGIVTAGKANQVAASSLLTVDAGAGYDLNGFDHTLNSIAGAGFITNSVASAATLTLGDSTNFTFAGVLADNTAGNANSKLNLAKMGTGTVTLTGANLHAGTVNVAQGTLRVAGTGSVGSGSVAVVDTLEYARTDTYVLPNVFSGTGALSFTGVGGVAKLTGTSPTNSLVVSVAGGTLQLGDNGTTGSLDAPTIALGSGATLRFARSDSYDFSTAISSVVTNNGVIEQAGAGTTKLVVSNSFTGDVSITAGELEAAGTSSLEFARQIVIGAAGSLRVSADDALGFGPGPDVIINGGLMRLLAPLNTVAQGSVHDLTLDGGTISSGSVGSGSNSLYLTGSLNVTNNATISARDVGLINFSSGAASGNATNITVATGKTLTFSGTITDDPYGNLSSFDKNGAGTMILSGNNAGMTGAVTVSGGTVVVNHANALGDGSAVTNVVTVSNTGRVTSSIAAPIAAPITVTTGGTIAVGDSAIGNLRMSSLTLSPGAQIELKIWDVTQAAGVGYDKIDFGALDLSGASAANKYKIVLKSMNSATTFGNAANLNLPTAPENFGSFDFGRFTVGSSTIGANISDVFSFDASQFTYTGGTASDAGLWRINFDTANGYVTLTAVPEPSTYGFALGALALAAAAIRRRRQVKKA
jgi:autotransporter-associated beta strand protein